MTMKHNFWIGLFVGVVSSLLGLALVGAVAAQSSDHGKALVMPAAPAQALPAPARASEAVITRTQPLAGGGGGPIGTAFRYQGLLKKNGAPFTGDCDMQFNLY